MFMIVWKYAPHGESWACGGRREHRSLDLGLQAVEPSDEGFCKSRKHSWVLRHPLSKPFMLFLSGIQLKNLNPLL